LKESHLEFDVLTGRKAEVELHHLVLDECLDDKVLNFILPAAAPLPWESSLWDYKRELPNTSGRGSPDERVAASFAVAELIKDVVSFHNAFGGYILAGIEQHLANPILGCNGLDASGFTVEKLNEQIAAYTRSKFMCKFRRISISGKTLGLLFIPMRGSSSPVVRMAKGAPERGGNAVFKKGDILARIGDSCLPVQNDLQGLQFVCSKRRLSTDIPEFPHIENNLPPKDPNLIRFVGRGDYFLKLWSWLIDRHTPVKVMTALGGTGKTAIAYEFCLHLLSDPPAWMSKLVWLTAKKQAFSAIQGNYVGVTRTDFESVDGFLRALASEIGAMETEIAQAENNDELLDLVLDGLDHFPSLVVVDDIDTLKEKQSDLFAIIQIIAGRSFDKGTRFLLTSRLDLGAGESQVIPLGGFEDDEFSEYARMVAAERGLKLDDGVIFRLLKASLGSPVFCASILRLVSLGADINAAIQQWKGRQGELVRKFAFERELEQLTESQARTLFALSALGETTQLELKQVLQVDDDQITNDLTKLRTFHLYASAGDPITGTKLEVPEPIRLMSDILRLRLIDPARIERECARTRSQVPKVKDRVAISIAAILALWRADEYDAALFSALQARKENSKSGDLSCIVGQCYLKIAPAKPEEADKAFVQAFRLGCGRPELIPFWLDAKFLIKDWNGIIDLATKIPPPEIRSGSAVMVLDAKLEMARQASGREDLVNARDLLQDAMLMASVIIQQQRAGDRLPDVRERCRSAAQAYVKMADRCSERRGDKLDVFNSTMDAFRCHVTETWIIDLGLTSIRIWAADAVERPEPDLGAVDILDRRLEDIHVLKDHLKKFDRIQLLARLDGTVEELNRRKNQILKAANAQRSSGIEARHR
jgi:hypothetical protein